MHICRNRWKLYRLLPFPESLLKLVDVLTRLENAGHRLSENESEFFKTEIERIGHKNDQNGIPPLQNKLMAIEELKKLNNEKEIFSGSHPVSAQIH